MKQLSVLLLLCTFAIQVYTQSELSGTINVYTAVLDVDDCTNALMVEQTAGFEAGMDVILLQTQGAVMDESNAAAFGSISDIAATGLYEKNTISAINGTDITLENALLHTYDPPSGLQLISMPAYTDATVTDVLSAQPWDGNTGGVLAFSVSNLLTLQANIDLTGTGFRGGISQVTANNNCGFLTNANNYFYDQNNWRGAPKGEGVVPIIPDKEMGRGAQANGGGGGNDHNSGGGGGSNISPGGQGGRNNEPSTFGCDGAFPGLGGVALLQDSTRIYLGGGGGSGHENNDVGTNGGNGGGIIIIEAAEIDFNGFALLSHGATPADGGGDGAGGGGGGGTIVLIAQTVASPVVEARGGDGGLVDNGGADRCMGPGGGGGGGHILSNLPLNVGANSDVSGGDSGLSINSSSCGDGSNEATPGTNGTFTSINFIANNSGSSAGLSIVDQPTEAGSCDDDPINLAVTVAGANPSYQWQIDTGAGFADLTNGADYTGTNDSVLTILAPTTLPLNSQFQLLVTDDCGNSINSDPITVLVGGVPTSNFTFNISGTTVTFINQTSGADAFEWNFGDGEESTEAAPVHTYPAPGNYQVDLTALNDCGGATTSLLLMIGGAPTAAFDYAPASGCAPLTVDYTNLSAGEITTTNWFFPGGTPISSTEENPSVNYSVPGVYTAVLVVTNDVGADTFALTDIITVAQPAQASFEVVLTDLNAAFTNTSTNGDSYQWEVVETGFTSSEENLNYAFPEVGNYTINLAVTNLCGTDTATETLVVGAAPSANFSATTAGGCAPLYVQFSNESSGTFDSFQWDFPGGDPGTSTEAMPTVLYDAPGSYDVTLTVNGSLGAAAITKEAIVEVLPYPDVNFNYEIVGNTVAFNNLSSPDAAYFWDFGDGSTSVEPNPVHTFSGSDAFDVTLSAQNIYCGQSTTQTIFVQPNAVDDPIPGVAIQVYPNPFSNAFTIEVTGPLDFAASQVLLFNNVGQLVRRSALRAARTTLEWDLPAGMYWLMIKNENGSLVRRVVKQ